MSFQYGNFGCKVLEPKCLRMNDDDNDDDDEDDEDDDHGDNDDDEQTWYTDNDDDDYNAHWTVMVIMIISMPNLIRCCDHGVAASLQSATSHATRSRLCHLIRGHHEAQDKGATRPCPEEKDKGATRPCQEEKDKHYRDPTDFPMLRPVLLLALATAVVMLYVVVAAQGAAFLRHRQTHLAYPTPWANDHRGLMWQ